jgi:FtsZ-interacting cell division protein ZipA
MTDLQTSLMAIGGTILVGVISYNKWQEYKAKKSVERAFSSSHDDVLMTNGDAVSADHGERKEPRVMPEQSAQHSTDDGVDEFSAQPMSAEVGAQLPVDELVDCIIPISVAAPVWGEKIIPTIQALRHVGNKPVHFIGQREDGEWEPIAHGVAYTALRAGVQLANRTSALNELEYSELITRLRQVADHLDAEPDVPDMTAVMHAAREMHQFVTEYDAQLSINVQSNGAPWAINTLLAALERQGFDVRPDGRLVMSDGDGGILFSISTNVTLASETTPRLTLLLDVPCVALLRDGFGAMTACARMLATRLDGNVVDDSGQPLTSNALNEIAEQVATFCAHMEAAGIPAGSTRALRLFS